MDTYIVFLETLYRVTKKLRTSGAQSFVKHLENPEKSRILVPITSHAPVSTFVIDALHMIQAGMSLEDLTFYMDGYRSRLVSYDKADIHLVNLVFRTLWAIAHNNWDPILCTEFGRATIPSQVGMTRKKWIAHCNNLEVDKTLTNINWDQMLEEIESKK
ncbi:MAG: hypothetical protein EKK46_12590 [Rhodocyclaceae bacterium]|nr:MAG: hypothetical protein EKK46_12590 [Rhodocyclaceae bacterium]